MYSGRLDTSKIGSTDVARIARADWHRDRSSRLLAEMLEVRADVGLTSGYVDARSMTRTSTTLTSPSRRCRSALVTQKDRTALTSRSLAARLLLGCGACTEARALTQMRNLYEPRMLRRVLAPSKIENWLCRPRCGVLLGGLRTMGVSSARCS